MADLWDMLSKFVLATGTGGIWDAVEGVKKWKDGGNFFDFIDRAIDPGGTVDTGTREFGKILPQEVRNVAPAIGGTVGSIWGPGGAAAGAGVGSKIQGADTQTGMRNAGIAATMSWLSGQGKDYFKGTDTAIPEEIPEDLSLDPSYTPTSDPIPGALTPADYGIKTIPGSGMSDPSVGDAAVPGSAPFDWMSLLQNKGGGSSSNNPKMPERNQKQQFYSVKDEDLLSLRQAYLEAEKKRRAQVLQNLLLRK